MNVAVKANIPERLKLILSPSELSTPSGTSATSYQVVIRMAKGKSTPLARGPMFTAESARETVTLIENWMERD
jgi:hypothetical protein